MAHLIQRKEGLKEDYKPGVVTVVILGLGMKGGETLILKKQYGTNMYSENRRCENLNRYTTKTNVYCETS